MPKVFTVQDVLDADDGDVINSFKGKVLELWPPKSGKSEKGEWSFQNLKLEDKDGETIKCTLKDREEMPKKFKGQSIIIVAAESGKRGKTGVYAKDDEYKGKTERILWVTGSAEITRGADVDDAGDDDEPKGKQRDNDDEEREEKEERKPARREREDSGDNDGDGDSDAVSDAKANLAKLGNLYCLCYIEAARTGKVCQEKSGVNLSEDHFPSMVHTLFIEANKRGIGDDLPNRPLFTAKDDDDK